MRRLHALAIMLSISGSARAGAPVIPPGQEALILDMLGGSSPIAGCKLLGAEVQKTWIAARYTCAGSLREIALELRHTNDGANAAERTERFIIATPSADPAAPQVTAALAAAIADRVRPRESRFLWDALEPEAPDPARPRPDMGRPHRAAILIALFALPLLGTWIRARRRA